MTTDTRAIVEVVGELVLDDGATLERQRGPQALTVARELKSELVSHLSGDQMRMAIWQSFQTDPTNTAPILVTAVETLLKADAALAQRLDTLLARYKQATGSTTAIRTGGAYVGGSVTTDGGAFVSGDVTTGGGDFVGRDQITITQGSDPETIAQAFRQFYAAVEARPNTSPQDKADLKTDLKEAEKELAKGDQADEEFLARHLRNVKRMAPDILDVVLATFANPIAGLGLVAKKIADKMKAEA